MKNRVIALIVFTLLCSCFPATIRAEYRTERKAAAAFVRDNDLWLAGCIILQRAGYARPDRG